MRSPEKQAAGETREDPHIRILCEQFYGEAQTKPTASIDIPNSTDVETRTDLAGGYLRSETDDTATKAPIAPVEDR
jgi:hypothetical protein